MEFKLGKFVSVDLLHGRRRSNRFVRGMGFWALTLCASSVIWGCSITKSGGGSEGANNSGGMDPNKACEIAPNDVSKVGALDYNVPVASGEIKIMSYNVENLFDAERTPGHDDITYLPLSHPDKAKCAEITNEYYRQECQNTDWTEQKVNLKIDQVVSVISEQGEAPDILGVQEIETEGVARKLGDRLGLKEVLITKGGDDRGINNALLFNPNKLRLIDWRSVAVKLDKGDTRDILIANFGVGPKSSQVLTVAVNHWPSQGNAPQQRILAAQTLRTELENESKRFAKSEHHSIAIGDFNTIPADEPHPFRDVLSAVSWKERMIAVNDVFRRAPNVERKIRNGMPGGSYYFGNDWQTLDYIFVDPGLLDGQGMEVLVESFRILASEAGSAVGTLEIRSKLGEVFKQSYRVPTGFEVHKDGRVVGASDHYPVLVKLVMNP